MGFSVAASSAIIFTGLMFSAVVVFSVVTDTWEEMDRTMDKRSDRDEEARDTEITLASYWYNSTVLTLNLTNSGTTQLHVDRLVLLANGTLITQDIINTTVDGSGGTNIWSPQQVLTVNVAHATAPPETVKVATENGKDVTFTVA